MDDASDSDIETKETRKLVSQQNRKKQKSGGFQAMGLSYPLYKGIIRKGYKVPTPIQRKTIPTILTGRDVVAMARTGSGKTAAFLIPMFERLKQHVTTGPRALILSPTRELALQTLKFAIELGKFTDLTAAVLLGGDKMEDQFAAIHNKPDILVATPGRLLHIIMEMNLNIKTIEYIVFDEGDRLFELGFAEQLQETLRRLPENRQTLIFSATLPGILVDFARAGLNEPKLIRLDVDNKLSDQLKLAFFTCTADDKTAILIHLLTKIVQKKQQTVVFLTTKHHVELMQQILHEAGLTCSYVYSDLDPEARKMHIQAFRNRQVDVLLVTDVAARGIDIPQLDNVINYNFPAKPKLFLHRVGRVARAGRTGMAYSLVSPDEMPFVLDLHLFLGREMRLADRNSQSEEQALIGRVPRTLIEMYTGFLTQLIDSNSDVAGSLHVCQNAMKNYYKTRPNPSPESVRRIKEMLEEFDLLACHPLLKESVNTTDDAEDILAKLRGFKCTTTIFEARGKIADPIGVTVMKAKRERYEEIVVKKEASRKRKREETLAEATKDKEFFIPYQRENDASERGLDVGMTASFALEAKSAAIDLDADAGGISGINRPVGSKKRWDKKKMKFVGESGDVKSKKIKTESGVWIPASYKTNKYETWLKHSKTQDTVEEPRDRHGGASKSKGKRFSVAGSKPRNFHTKNNSESSSAFKGNKKGQQLLKPEQILKERKRKQKVIDFQKKRQLMNKEKKGGRKR